MRKSALLGTVLLLAVWFLVTETGLISKLFLPSPIATFRSLYSLIVSRDIFSDGLITLYRTVLGFLIGSGAGVPLGLVMGHYKKVYQTMEFPVDFFRSIPATALFPLFIVIWGLGDNVKVFIAAWASSMVVLINTMYGVRSVAPIRLAVARLRRLPPLKRFYRVTVPNSLPYILAGVRIGLSLALVVEIVAEMFLGSQSGLGRRIFNASSIFEMEEAYATVLVVGLLGYGLNKIVILTERRLVHWAGK